MNAIRSVVRPFVDWFRNAHWVVRTAPLLLLPILLAEGVQHVAEIRLGMFASKEAFRALAMDPTRWVFGYAKIAGLLISVVLVARYIALRSIRRALVPNWRMALCFVAVMALSYGISAALQSAAAHTTAPVGVLKGIDVVLQLLFTLPLAATLFEDRWSAVRAAGWRVIMGVVLMVLLMGLTMVVLQPLHSANHSWALGKSLSIVAVLMVFDTLVVGVMALFLGSGLATGWRWAVKPVAPEGALPPSPTVSPVR